MKHGGRPLDGLHVGDMIRLRLADLGCLKRGLRGFAGTADVYVVAIETDAVEVTLAVCGMRPRGRPPVWRVPLDAECEVDRRSW